MLASWGTFLKRQIHLLGTAASLLPLPLSFPFLSFLFSSFPLSFSFVCLQIENKENKTVLNFSPVPKSFRMLNSQSLLLCIPRAKKKQVFTSTLRALVSLHFFFLSHCFVCAFLSFALAILQYCRDSSFPSCVAIREAAALAVWIVEMCNYLTVRGCWWLAGGLKMVKRRESQLGR